MATYATWVAQTRAELEESSASIWSDASLMAFTNEVAEDLANRVRDPQSMTDEEYLTTVAGTESYALPDEYTVEVLGLRWDSDNTPLARIGMEDYFSKDLTSDDGVPCSYMVWNNTVYLYPTPSTADTLRLFRSRRPTPITATTDSMPFASRYDRIIRDGVKARCYEQIGDSELASLHDSKYQRAVAEAEFQVKDNAASDAFYTPKPVW